MAQDIEQNPSQDGTEQVPAQEGQPYPQVICPTWEGLGGNGSFPEFFKPGEELKKKGFEVMFLSSSPRKETINRFNPDARDLWFEINHQGTDYTWTISQVSLLVELKKLEPLAGKTVRIRLVPVDEEFRKQRPKYRGKDRYQVELVPTTAALNKQGGAAYAASPSSALAQDQVVATNGQAVPARV